jgi:voltage-gated potassium channel
VTDTAPTGAAEAPGAGRRSEWVLGSRVSRLRAAHSFGLVLLIAVIEVFFALLAPDGAWSASLLILIATALLMTALWTSGLARATSRSMAVVAILGICAAAARMIDRGDAVAVTVGIVSGLMVVAAILVIARGVVDQREINLQSVRGALAIYVLLGLAFQFAYSVVVLLDSSPFFTNGGDGTRAIRTYFSYVTLATLGYGDYTPASNLGHAIAVVEAISGQLYLVIVITVMVGRLGQRRPG